MERPESLAGLDVVAAHIAARRFPVRRTVADVRARDDHVLDDDRCGVDRVVALAFGVLELIDHVRLAVGPEGWIGLARLGVDRNQVRVVRAADDPPLCPIGPVGHAAVREAEVRRPAASPDLGVALPDRLAADRIDRGKHTESCLRVEDTVDHQRRVLIRARAHQGVVLLNLVVGRRPAPGNLERVHVRFA